MGNVEYLILTLRLTKERILYIYIYLYKISLIKFMRNVVL